MPVAVLPDVAVVAPSGAARLEADLARLDRHGDDAERLGEFVDAGQQAGEQQRLGVGTGAAPLILAFQARPKARPRPRFLFVRTQSN